MKIKIIKQFDYKGCPVIIRRLNKFTFEYLLIYENKFYGTFIDDKMKWWQLWKLLIKEPYSNKQLNGMVYFMTKTAETTIESLLKKNEK